MTLFLKKAAAIFFLLVILFLPLPFGFGEVQQQVSEFLFLKPVIFIQHLFFEDSFQSAAFSSDTRSLNILVSLLLILAVIISAFLKGAARKLIWAGRTATAYYLVFILFKYGIDKVLTAQFYTPQPNILYTPFGQLSKDILYWSTMGVSPAYSVITGCVEVIAALLLLFRWTRIVGLFVGAVALANVVVINFAFDISVKTFSVVLLVMALYGLAPVIRTLYRFLILQKTETLPVAYVFHVKPYFRTGIKFFVAGLMIIQVLYPYLEEAPSCSKICGAYNVEKVFEDDMPLALHEFPVKRIFVLKTGYIIFQHHDDSMKDYYFEEDTEQHVLLLHEYDGGKRSLAYSYSGTKLVLYLDRELDVKIVAQKLDVSKLPALQDEIHLTIDDLR